MHACPQILMKCAHSKMQVVNALIECLTAILETIDLILLGRAFVYSTHKIIHCTYCVLNICMGNSYIYACNNPSPIYIYSYTLH